MQCKTKITFYLRDKTIDTGRQKAQTDRRHRQTDDTDRQKAQTDRKKMQTYKIHAYTDRRHR